MFCFQRFELRLDWLTQVNMFKQVLGIKFIKF